MMLETTGKILESRSTFCRERQHMLRAFSFVASRFASRCFLQYEMSISPTEAEAAYSSKARLFSRRPLPSLRRDDERRFLQGNIGIEILKMGLSGNLTVSETEQHLDQAGYSCRSFQMTDIGLD